MAHAVSACRARLQTQRSPECTTHMPLRSSSVACTGHLVTCDFPCSQGPLSDNVASRIDVPLPAFASWLGDLPQGNPKP